MTPDAPAPTDAGLAGDLFALITHIHKNCTGDLLEAVGMLDLNLSQIKLLHRLEGAGRELSLGQAAESIGITLPTASRLVDDLVHRGLIQRREDASDRRLKRICLTESGHGALRRLGAARLSGLEEFVGTLTEAEHRTLHHTLTTLLSRPEIAACRYGGTDR